MQRSHEPATGRFSTPLRYPGGKGRLSRFFQLVVEQNSLCDVHYVEPYCGGAGVAFPLLFLQYATHIHLNDFNRSVYCFWNAVLYETDALCKMIANAHLKPAEWRKQRQILNEPSKHSALEVAFATFFMNRCNRSGIINGGMIGGGKQDGKWKINARFNKTELISRIRKIAQHRNRISLYNLDAEQFLGRLNGKLPSKTLIYLDPPYYTKGAGLYEDHYKAHDHERLSRFVQKRLRHHWVVSYDNRREICELYARRRCIQYNLSYTAGDRYFGTEVMFFSDDLIIPKVVNPARLTEHPKSPVVPATYIGAMSQSL